MPKFKNKKNGVVIEESLNFYIDKLRKNPNFEEIKENRDSNPKTSPKKQREEEVEATPQQ